ncbi:NIPSNAP family protein [Mesorhizobium microcysteis]|uniref:NIPSNAP family protein n=1 Tax=Neoaquamicrobium microcysteis TaxID=2682781 RepID=A0A5D4GT62_9HYPH|nr:NIPSNAP family protein [Mesorhizobium microcysteis]TYR30465.1 NIPSNAP family protein [Mesorhizobium microcysteis]
MLQVHTVPALLPVDTAVVELRQYTLHPGARETLVALFDKEFVETQEACGMSVLGQFRDLDRPDHFVWLRGFADMDRRAEALAAFYDGPVWRRHRDAANATMIDSDDVLLLRPSAPAPIALLDRGDRPSGASELPGSVFEAVICPVAPEELDAFAQWFASEMEPALNEAGGDVVASFVTEPARNTYPRLPVREDASVFVWLAQLKAGSPLLHPEQSRVGAALSRELAGRTEPVRLRLAPTARSLLR